MILESLFQATEPLFGMSFAREVRAVLGDYYRVWNRIETLGAVLTELRQTNDSLLTTKQNEIVKTFTILAFMTLPISMVASVFGMNTENTPIVGDQHDFWLIVILMAALAAFFFGYFRHRHWL
jgi:magnesium transporter